MKILHLFLIVVLILTTTSLFAKDDEDGNEAPITGEINQAVSEKNDETGLEPESEWTKQAKAGADLCKKKLAQFWGTTTGKVVLGGGGAALVMTTGVLTYNNAFNTRFPDGNWDENGRPDVGENLIVSEKIDALTFGPRVMWVHNGRNGFGRVYFGADGIQYKHGNETVAYTGIDKAIAPKARPENEHPTRHIIYDKNGMQIGAVLEHNEMDESDLNRVKVWFSFEDVVGRKISQTEAFYESWGGNSEKPIRDLSVRSPSGKQKHAELSRKGWLTQQYQWKREDETLDPRLQVIISAYKSYVDEHRDDL